VSSWCGGLVFVGLMFLGAGVGLLVGQVVAGFLIGMGLGFVVMEFLCRGFLRTPSDRKS